MDVVMLALYRFFDKKTGDKTVALFYAQIIPALVIAFLVIDVYMLVEYAAGVRFSTWPYENARTAIFVVVGVVYLGVMMLAPKTATLEKMEVTPEVLHRSTNLAWILFSVPFIIFVLVVSSLHS